jgi:hypothetical protein
MKISFIQSIIVFLLGCMTLTEIIVFHSFYGFAYGLATVVLIIVGIHRERTAVS